MIDEPMTHQATEALTGDMLAQVFVICDIKISQSTYDQLDDNTKKAFKPIQKSDEQ